MWERRTKSKRKRKQLRSRRKWTTMLEKGMTIWIHRLGHPNSLTKMVVNPYLTIRWSNFTPQDLQGQEGIPGLLQHRSIPRLIILMVKSLTMRMNRQLSKGARIRRMISMRLKSWRKWLKVCSDSQSRPNTPCKKWPWKCRRKATTLIYYSFQTSRNLVKCWWTTNSKNKQRIDKLGERSTCLPLNLRRSLNNWTRSSHPCANKTTKHPIQTRADQWWGESKRSWEEGLRKRWASTETLPSSPWKKSQPKTRARVASAWRRKTS